MRRFVYIVLLFCVLSIVSSCHRSVIPRERMMQVIKEMMITDVRIQSVDSLSRLADSTAVYEAVLHSMGYSVPEFEKTINYYINRPDRFRSLVKKLQEEVSEERKLITAKEAFDELMRVKRRKYNNWLQDSLPNTLNAVQKAALLQIMAPDPSSIPVWRMDQDSLYVAPKLRVLPVLDTITQVDSIPKYLVPPKRILPRITIKILQ